jgi:hypothetical protein
MQYDHVAADLGIFGMKGMGKTSFAMRYLANCQAKVRFIFDARGEFAERLKLPPAETPDQVAAAVRTGWVCYRPWAMYRRAEDGLAWFSDVCFSLGNVVPGNKKFVVDELQRFTSGNYLPESLEQMASESRRQGIDFVMMAQSPNLLHNAIRGQLVEMVCFRLNSRNGCDCAAEEFGFDPEELRGLARHHWIARTVEGREVRG